MQQMNSAPRQCVLDGTLITRVEDAAAAKALCATVCLSITTALHTAAFAGAISYASDFVA